MEENDKDIPEEVKATDTADTAASEKPDSGMKRFKAAFSGFTAKLRRFLPLQVLVWLSALVFPFYCLFVMEYFNYYTYDGLESVCKYFKTSPGFHLALIIVYVLFIVLVLVCKRLWIAGGVMGFVSILFSAINFIKLALNGDNFFPKDITMAGSAGELLSFVTVSLPLWFWLALIIFILWTAVFAIMGTKLPVKWFIRLPAAVLTVVLAILPLMPSNAEKTLNGFGLFFEDTALQTSNYYANGFVSAFTINALMTNRIPDGYSKENIESLLAPYTATPRSGDELYDVIVVLNESFFDIRTMPGLTFSEDPLTGYDEVRTRDNCYSGKLYATALGGGTVRPEFEMLTGLDTDYLLSGSSPWEFVSSPMESFVSLYRDAGYDTIALHPYDKKFYSRSSAYPFAGFKAFYGLSDVAQKYDFQYKRGYATDESTFRVIKDFLDQSINPTFMFVITMQNHQAFNPLPESEINIQVTHPTLEKSLLDSVVTYTQGVYDADKMLSALADYVDSREKPTILVFFGDHLPTLGANLAAYDATGFFDASDGQDHDERMKLYSTPFIIYSNRDIDIPIFPEHTGNMISSYNMLNAVSLATGFERTPYMNMLLDFYKVAPAYNVRLLIPETEEIKHYTDIIRLVTYDRTSGNKWSQELE